MSEEEVIAEANAARACAAGSETEESWKAHVLCARDFRGTNTEYCRRNRLDPSVFRSYKKKFGRVERSRPKPQAFVQIQCEAPVRSAPQAPRKVTLPDPRWLGEFVAALLAAGP